MEQELFVNLSNSPMEYGRWVSCPRPNPTARVRLFFFPYAGAGTTTYSAWSGLFPMEIEPYLIHLPGRDQRINESPYIECGPLAEALTQALHPLLDKPFSFFGHSLGGLLSFEVVRQLRRQDSLLPIHLFVSGRLPPHLPDSRPKLHGLPETAFLSATQERFGILPQVVREDPELLKLFLSILRADLALSENYQYIDEAPLACPVTAFGGLQDDTVTQDELSAWREQTEARFELRMLPGDHFFIQASKEAIAQSISEDLGGFIRRLVNC
jgi:medium-chain acyl-[acyl-carrier-protein] hydrolase